MSIPRVASSSPVSAQTALEDAPAVAIQVSRDIVVASIQVDLDDRVLARFSDELLQRIHETDSRGVILDLSGLETLDCHEFSGLRRIITRSEIMGAKAVLVGLRPGVVSALIEAGAEVDGLKAAINLDAAYAILQPQPSLESVFERDPNPHPDPGLEYDAEPGSESGVQL